MPKFIRRRRLRLRKTISGYQNIVPLRGDLDTYSIQTNIEGTEADVKNSAGEIVATVSAPTKRELISRLEKGLQADFGMKPAVVSIQSLSFPNFERQLVSFSNVPTSGQFKLVFNAIASPLIQYNATAEQVQSALRTMGAIENLINDGLEDVLVTGNFTAGFVVDFRSVPGNLAMMTASDNTLMYQAPGPVVATGSPILATAANYAVIASSTITNTGSTVITGNIALSPGTSVTGFPPGTVSGTQDIANAAASQAQTDATAAYVNLQSRPAGTAITAGAGGLNGLSLAPGTYTSASSMDLAVGATLTLDGGGNTNSLWIFQAGSTVSLGNGSTVALINGATANNVYWQVGSSATIGTTAVARGTFIAAVSCTANTSANISGRLIARTGAVSLDTVAIAPSAAVAPVAVSINITEQLAGGVE